MKKVIRKQNFMVVMLLAFASIISYSGSFLLNGEPKPPKSLIK